MDSSAMLLIYLLMVYSGMVINTVSSACPPGSYYDWNQKQCSLCEPGMYKTNDWNAYCDQCRSGTYSSTSGAISCTNCEAGKYQPNWGQSWCYQCQYGKTTINIGSTLESECVCPPGSYYNWNQHQCSLCEPGKYKAYAGNAAYCDYCRSGTYTSSSGAISCTDCEAGKYQPSSGQTSCKSCEIGKYQPNEGTSWCHTCEYGKTTINIGSTSESECVCPPGSYYNWNQHQCSLCEPGKYKAYAGNAAYCDYCRSGTYTSSSGAISCTDCEAGKYQPSSGQTSCKSCEIGKYQPNEGTSWCHTCEYGKTTINIGSTSESECDCGPGKFFAPRSYACQDCQAGMYKPISGESTCLSCEPGTFQNQTGQLLCSPCLEGTYQPSRGASSCIACAAGMYQNRRSSTYCLACSVGTFQNATGQNYCITCPAGSYTDATQATNCMPCETGSYQSSAGRSSCTPCPIGHYQPFKGQMVCYPCASGKTTTGTGSTSLNDCITACSAGSFRSSQSSACENCPTGSYQPLTGQTSCVSCEAGTYQNQTGQTSCMKCVPGSYQSSVGSESCIKCSPGFFLADTGSSSQCLVCPVGTYQDLPGAVSCNKCLVGTFQNQTGQIICVPCPKGSYQSSVCSNKCLECPPGMYQNSTAQSLCLECPPGSYKSDPGSELCTKCDVGMYQHLSGQISCYTCPNGTNTTGIGTKSVQECYSSENDVRTGADSNENKTNIGGIAGGAGGAIALLVVVAIVIFIAIRRHRLKETSSHKPSRQSNVIPPSNNRQLETSIQQQRREVVYTNLVVQDEDSKEKYMIDVSDEYTSTNNTYYNMEENAFLPRGAVMLSNLWDYVQEKTLDGSKLSEEFEALPSGLLSPVKAALKPSNCQKNRYKGLYPYDSTRVKLLPLGEDKSDYINASFIDGYSRPKAYIASQGTTKFNINDFWRMIYQQDVEKIVMLTRLAEGDTIKCLQYWPNEGSQQQYGGIKVTLVHVDAFAEYDIRTLTMTVENTTKQVTQFHFTAWPDKGVPAAASSIVQFWHKVRNAQPHKQSPTVVHCSAGIGRTGTYIALDYLVDQGKDKQYVHIFPCVAQLRGQRVNLVQTEAQYRFLHEALVEALMVSGSAVSAEKFPNVYKELLEIDRKQRKTGLLIEFEKLQNESNKAAYHPPRDNDTDDEEEESESKKETTTNNPQRTSRLEINKHKNRYSNILPADEYRPCLSLVEGRTDYINAVKLQSHRQKDGLIVTQMPMEDTVIDFWRLVYDFGVRTIVMLNVLPMNKDSIGVYWPSKGESMTEAFFNIETVDESTDNTDYLWRTIRLTKGGEQPREVRQFQCKFWPGSEKVPLETEAMLKLIDGVEQWQRQADIKIVVIHCMDGAERSGLYCVLTTVLERLNVERDVAIYQTVKKMRTRRQQIIPNFEQYKYCHDVVLEYLSNFGTYSNFSEI